MNKDIHHPVLLESVVELLNPKVGESYLDLTAGYGGHAEAILHKTGFAPATLVDRDVNAITELKAKFVKQTNVEILQTDFASAAKQLIEANKQYDMILADLGVSSPHLDNPERGFSFSLNGPLDMRMDQHQTTTAADLLNSLSIEEVASIFKKYGEEPSAKRLSAAIITARPLLTTGQLADVIKAELGEYRAKKVLPRVFQALRIVVNDEFHQLETLLSCIISLLKPRGRVALISFHSLEDRLVKQFFKQKSFGLEAELTVKTKKPIEGKHNDIHPRARSAKLRVAVK